MDASVRSLALVRRSRHQPRNRRRRGHDKQMEDPSVKAHPGRLPNLSSQKEIVKVAKADACESTSFVRARNDVLLCVAWSATAGVRRSCICYGIGQAISWGNARNLDLKNMQMADDIIWPQSQVKALLSL